MNNFVAWACFATMVSLGAQSQVDAPTFKAEVRNTFIWGEDVPSGAISSTITDPLTGAEILKLKHQDVEVISRMGFEKLNPEDMSEFIAYSTTIINNTGSDLHVQLGGITVDGRLISPLTLDSHHGAKKHRATNVADAVDVETLHCFKTGNLSSEVSSAPPRPARVDIVAPQSSSTISGVIKDPRHGPLLCTADGCFPKGTIRYSIRVGSHEYIFVWNGRSIVNCGR